LLVLSSGIRAVDHCLRVLVPARIGEEGSRVVEFTGEGGRKPESPR
jgi:hypothetical protein